MGRRTTPFLGRESELADLRSALARARAGQATIVAIGGTSGIGKTRLAARMVELARADSIETHVAACPELISAAPIPYAPFTGIARSIVRHLDVRLLDEILGGARAGLSALLPELGRPDRSDVAAAEVAEAMLLLLDRVARAGPILLVLDDLHRAGPTGVDILVWLAHELRSAPILLIATLQTDRASSALLDTLSTLDRLDHVERMELAPLRDEVARAFLHEVSGTLPEAFEAEVLRRAAGLPLFLEELGAGGDATAVPASLRLAIRRRIERMSEEAAWMVRAAAVVGEPVDGRLLAATTTATAGPQVVLRQAMDEGLLLATGTGGEEVAVYHSLVADALLVDLLPGERGAIAGRLCNALTTMPGLGPRDAADRARLLARLFVASGDRPAAMRAFRDAATLALAANAFPEADAAFAEVERLAAEEGRDGRADGGWLQQAARAASLAGRSTRAVTLQGAAVRVISDRDERGIAEVRLARYEAASGALDAAIGRLRSAIGPDVPGATRRRAALELGRLLLGSGDADHAVEYLRLAHLEAGRAGDRLLESATASALAVALMQSGRHREAWQLAGEVVTAGVRDAPEPQTDDRLSHLPIAVTDLLERVRLRDEHHDHEQALVAAGEASNLLESLGLGATLGEPAAALRALELVRIGRWDEAAEQLAARRHVGPGRVVEALLLTRRGEVDTARAMLHEVQAASLVTAPGAPWLALRALADAEGARATSQLSEARRAVAAGLRWAGASSLAVELCTLGIAVEADVASRARDRRRPRDIEGHEEIGPSLSARAHLLLRSITDEGVDPSRTWCIAWSARVEAETARMTGRQPDVWDRAVRAADDALGPFERATARLAWAAEALATGWDRREVRTRLLEARQLGLQIGARPVAEESERLAAAARLFADEVTMARASSPARREALAVGLSNREVDVLALLGEGLGDRAIAARLYVSERTVNHHVSHALTKLGLDRRGELTALAHRLGLAASDVDP